MTESGNTFEQQEPNGSNPMPEGSEKIGTHGNGSELPQTPHDVEALPETTPESQPSSVPQPEQSSEPRQDPGDQVTAQNATPGAPEPSSEEPSTAPETAASDEAASQTPATAEADAPAAATPAPAEETQPAAETPAASEEAHPAEEAGAEGAHGDDGSGEGRQGGRRGGRGSKLPQLSEPEMREIWSELSAKKDANEAIELEVISRNRGGVVTHYKGVEVFIPMSHWTLLRQADEPQGESKGNEKVLANVLEMTDFDTDARRVTATRRPILRKSLLESLEVGQHIQGRVSSILDFGVFVDLGGIDGLLHTSEISYTRGRHPSQLLTKGEELEVVVREIDREKERIYLGRKELLPSPWDEAETKYPVSSTQNGKVVGLGKMGAFVELEPGIEGFVRASELSWTKRIHNPKEVLKKGQDIQVKVLDVSGRKKRLSLSYRQAQPNPWETLSTKYAVGTSWEGEIKEISNKGLVVGLDDVEGFLPRGRMGREAKRLPDMKDGDKITVSVIEVDPQRLSLIFGLPMPEREERSEGGGGNSGGGGGERRGGGGGDRGGDRGDRGDRRGGRDDRRGPMPSATPINEMKSSDTVGSFSIGDMIGQSIKEKLFPNLTQEQRREEKPKQAPKSEQEAPASQPGSPAQPEETPEAAPQAASSVEQPESAPQQETPAQPETAQSSEENAESIPGGSDEAAGGTETGNG